MTAIAYEQDYYGWTQQTAQLIRHGNFTDIDLEHLAEELEDMGAYKERELENRLGILLAHLLKWRYQPERRGSSWRLTIKEQRQRILRILRRNPSLKAHLDETCRDAYSDAILIAARETGLPETLFPQENSLSWEQTISDFWPE